MKITCDKQALGPALRLMAQALPLKSATVSLVARGGQVSLVGSDDDACEIRMRIPASVQRKGDSVFSLRGLSNFVSQMDGDTVTLDCDEQNVAVLAGDKARMTFPAVDNCKRPQPHQDEDRVSMQVPRKILLTVIAHMRYVFYGKNRSSNAGILVDISNEMIRVCGEKDRQYAVSGTKVGTRRSCKMSLCGDSARMLFFLLKTIKCKTVYICCGQGTVRLRMGDCTVSILIPDYTEQLYVPAIPERQPAAACVCARELAQSLDRVGVIANTRFAQPVAARPLKGALELLGSSGYGLCRERVPCSLTEDVGQFAFDFTQLMEAVRAVGRRDIRLEVDRERNLVSIRPDEGDEFFYAAPLRALRNTTAECIEKAKTA